MSRANIHNVETTGASRATAQQDGLEYSGVRASQQLAKTDADRVRTYRSHIRAAASRYGVDPAVIAAIMSRESRAGNCLNNGYGDNGNAWGLMQVDLRWHQKIGDWNSYEHIEYATKVLVGFIGEMSQRGWSAEQALKGGLAAYNMGPSSVRSYAAVDENTTGQDYSNDVVARAQWYKNNLSF